MADKLATVAETCAETPQQLALARDGEEEWAAKDQRRGELIDKKYTVGLIPEEQQELDQLQAEMEQRLDAIAPISFEVVEAMEEVIRTNKADQKVQQGEVQAS